MLTLLIETVYTRQSRLLPGRVLVNEDVVDIDGQDGGQGGQGQGQGQDEVYMAAARRIDRKTLKRITGLSARYHHALQRYHEVGFFSCHL